MTPTFPKDPENGNQDQAGTRPADTGARRPTRDECMAAAARVLAEIRTELAIEAGRIENGLSA